MNYRKIISNLLGFFVIFIIFAVPVYFGFWPKSYNLFEMAKFSLFKVSLALSWSLLSIILLVDRQAFRRFLFFWYKSWRYLIPLFAFFLYSSAIAIFSADQSLNFFGSYWRQDGAISILYLFAWFIIAASYIAISQRKDFLVKTAAPVLAASAALVSVYGICQFFGFDFLVWPESPLLSRIFSTFGQPNFLAGFLILSIPFSAYLAYGSRYYIRLTYGLALLLQMAALLMTSSRSSLLGLLVGFLFFVALQIMKGKGRKMAWLSLIIAAFLFLVAMAFNPRHILSSFNSGSAMSRLNFYHAGASAWSEKPWFGHGGPASIFSALLPYYEPEWSLTEKIGSLPDRTHNVILDILVSYGLAGLLLILGWLWYWRHLYGSYRSPSRDLVAVSAVSYLTSLMFGFFTVSCLIILFFFVACLVAERQDGQGKDFGIKRGFYIFPVLILPLSIIAAIFEIQTWRADQLANDMHIASYRSDIVAASSSYQSIGDIMTYPSFRDYYSILYAELLIRAQDLAADQEYVKRSLDLVGSSLSESFSGQMLKAVIYYRLGVNDKADAIFASIQSASRLFPSSYYLQGREMVRSGDYEKAIWPLYLAQASVPDLKDGRFNDLHLRESSLFLSEIYLSLGQAYLSSGELELARDYFKRSIATNIHQAKAIKGVADSYYLAGDMDGAVKYIIWGRIRFPEDSAWAEALRAIPGK